MAYKRDTFKTNVSYSVPLKILLDYFEELEHKHVPMAQGAQGTAALSSHVLQPILPAACQESSRTAARLSHPHCDCIQA